MKYKCLPFSVLEINVRTLLVGEIQKSESTMLLAGVLFQFNRKMFIGHYYQQQFDGKVVEMFTQTSEFLSICDLPILLY